VVPLGGDGVAVAEPQAESVADGVKEGEPE
jgi:hypothetical protein